MYIVKLQMGVNITTPTSQDPGCLFTALDWSRIEFGGTAEKGLHAADYPQKAHQEHFPSIWAGVL